LRKIPYNILFTKGHIFLEKDMEGQRRGLNFNDGYDFDKRDVTLDS